MHHHFFAMTLRQRIDHQKFPISHYPFEEIQGLVELGSYSCLLELRCLHEWLPGSIAGLGMFTLRARNVKLPYIAQETCRALDGGDEGLKELDAKVD